MGLDGGGTQAGEQCLTEFPLPFEGELELPGQEFDLILFVAQEMKGGLQQMGYRDGLLFGNLIFQQELFHGLGGYA